jgi:hypothetical protein
MNLLAVVLLALSLPANLETRLKSAYSDIAKAKSALSSGQSKTSQSLLSKAEGLLKSVLNEASGSSLLKGRDASAPVAQQGDPQQNQTGASRAAQEAAKIDPALAAKLGVPQQHADPDAGTSGEVAPKTGLAGIEDTLKKVSEARALLKLGQNSKAKGLLERIPGL